MLIMAGLYRYIITGCLLCGGVLAQEPVSVSSPLDEYMEAGAEVSGVRVPFYDEKGRLKARLVGGHAKVLEGGRAGVTNIRIEVFEEGAVVMTLFAPECYVRVQGQGEASILFVESDGDVLIELKQGTVTGRGFRFDSSGSRFEILSDARVLVDKAAVGVKEEAGQ